MKIGFLCLPVPGHLNPMTALARKLQSRGHEMVFVGVPDNESVIRAAGLDFVPFCEEKFPIGSMAKTWGGVAKLRGMEALKYSAMSLIPDLLEAGLKHLPQKIRETGIEFLLLDVSYRFLELVPIAMGVPFVQIVNIVPGDRSGTTPPYFFSWPHETTPEARARNIEGLKKIGSLFGPTLAHAKAYVEKNGLSIDWSDPNATASKLAIVAQTPKEFDFPGIPWPPQFHYAGPFHDDRGREPVSFPWEKLTGQPLIYASLGTLLNGLEEIYKTILAAVRLLPDVQLVLSVGKNINPADLGPIPSNAIVVSTAPQIELLKRAALCITHAGLNTALESLGQGVPMVAIPNTYDQPGVASRIAYHRVGEFIEIDELSEERLTELILKVMRDPAYRDKALYFRDVIAKTHGLDIAADVIEQVFRAS
ncbi:MGT family glycosyltransferase [Silvibacterium bohemicum]|uniref:MGT family glycosyltransferase n=1 Tax=Silvibacterium bohemicum TaxID=1577686 RepID=A0A841JYU6_9BACT|nr:nucleotide disphospho-sugar-binding domain-containing protein [Silvibacterium bohemicum]MBB6146643.1 MGT family glycosyltransferase [Silvibacterium bohemicum]